VWPGVQFALCTQRAHVALLSVIIKTLGMAGTIRCNNGWAASGSCSCSGLAVGTVYKYEVRSPEGTCYRNPRPPMVFSMKYGPKTWLGGVPSWAIFSLERSGLV